MSERDLKRIEVLSDVRTGRRTVAAAAAVLSCVTRRRFAFNLWVFERHLGLPPSVVRIAQKIHAVQAGDTDLPIQLDLREEIQSAEKQEARRRIGDLQQMVGTDVPVRVAVGSVKEALLEAARGAHADALMIGRSHQPGAHGRMRDLIYAMVRDSPFSVLGV